MNLKLKTYNLFIIGILGLIVSCKNNNQTIKSTILNEKIIVFEQGDTIYLRSKSWGLVGNSKTILIKSYKDRDFVYDSIRDYRIEGEEFIFLKAKSDSMIIYLEHEVKSPSNFDSRIKIKQVELNGSQFRDFFENYKKIGVEKFY